MRRLGEGLSPESIARDERVGSNCRSQWCLYAIAVAPKLRLDYTWIAFAFVWTALGVHLKFTWITQVSMTYHDKLTLSCCWTCSCASLCCCKRAVFMQVNLFVYPCVAESAPHYAHRGHCSHVMGVRWSSCSRYAVSVGGKDRTVFLWRLAPARQETKRTPSTPPWASDPGMEVGCFWKPSPVSPQERPRTVHAVPSVRRQEAWK